NARGRHYHVRERHFVERGRDYNVREKHSHVRGRHFVERGNAPNKERKLNLAYYQGLF
ncbi:MAG: hypothetical protein JWO32_2022, partial [Bacteroidetes bacterium]|nr:hypothetical protein [Bacteroidota bacterium]